MGFLGVYKAVYDYSPRAENELAITEGDLLFVLEKSDDDDWWKAKKKADSEDEEEPEGLVPNNYVEEAPPQGTARALYDYTRQTDEEISFTEDAVLDIYDTSDPDWTLVGFKGEYGFAPSNYIEETSEAPPPKPARTQAPTAPREPEPAPEPGPGPYPISPARSPSSPVQSPAAALAGIIQQKTGDRGAAPAPAPRPSVQSPPLPARPVQYTPEESEEEAPAPSLPRRPPSEVVQQPPAMPTQYATTPSRGRGPSISSHNQDEETMMPHSPNGYHLYNIHEMVSSLGKNKKMPMTLGINIPRGIIMISPEKSRDGPQREWTADKLTHYSIEGKHVFMELIKPSRSIDFHAGAKDTAHEIVSALGELAGAARAEGLREVLAAGAGGSNVQKKGVMQFDFMAQGEDEVTVAAGDEVIVLDDTKSDEWWMVRRLKNGKQGVVPSNYVEITQMTATPQPPPSMKGVNAGRSVVDQNRLEEERLTREAMARSASTRKRGDSDATVGTKSEVGPGLHLPERNSSLMARGADGNARRASTSQRHSSKRESHGGRGSQGKSKPDPSKVRTWTDRSGSFKVEAEFIGLRDGKIHLHKLNGVKIAVPVSKMSIEDIEFVEADTGASLDEDKPLSDIKRRSTQRAKDRQRSGDAEREDTKRSRAGIAVEQQPKKPEYDWFDFFLQCGVNPQICERYARAFSNDQMGEENLPDISDSTLRTLGLKEGDILRVMKFLDNKYERTGAKAQQRNVSFGDTSVMEGQEGSNGPLFSGPGGALKNNTRKGRPAPAVQTNDVVDPKAFEQKSDDTVKKGVPQDAAATPIASAPPPKKPAESGFEDNAWEVKPSKSTPSSTGAPTPATSTASPPPQQQTPAASAPPPQPPTGAMNELSLLSQPLQPTPAPPQQPQQQQLPPQQQPQPQQPPPGATPGLFEKLAAARGSPPQGQPQPQLTGFQPQPTGFNPQQTGFNPQANGFQPQQTGFQQMGQRQRPQAPQMTGAPNSLIAPPPPRASSAPQNPQQPSAFGPPQAQPLQAQLTGMPTGGFPNMHAQVSPPGQSMQELTAARQMWQQQPQPQPNGAGQGGPQQPLMAQPTGMGFGGFGPQPAGFANSVVPALPQGFAAQPAHVQQQFLNGQVGQGSPFADPGAPRINFQQTGFPGQPTGFGGGGFGGAPQGMMPPQQTGINAFLPPALTPQRTGAPQLGGGVFGGPQQQQQQQSPPPQQQQPQGNGFLGAGGARQQTGGGGLQPLVAQKTGPPPPVRFGVSEGQRKLAPQPTGKRANLSMATPQNPFGF
ncbi:hypothetical protein BDY21DRAFT_370018 [Lineolata rhizophorae]|uniref:Actin cytoskeleton-regulatory complex protein SLA1 n=1 Tax=Lineolata rhizophorae TaxID=578093 RepID=A0A6A6P8P0_9PEZI|nr:hypothetical protein BDY21DRAFT_370018 [Lineolata rhizophorae]